MNRKLIRNIVGGLSFTSALFIFQACYGIPQDMLDDIFIEGRVISKSTHQPVEGIRVKSDKFEHYGITDSMGEFSFYTPWIDSLKLFIDDTDPGSDGSYASKDTTLLDPEHHLFLNIVLEEL